MDYRKIENREEAFLLWYEWGLAFEDVDPSIYLANYLLKRYEFNEEQVLWFIWLYGTTYQLATTWIIWNEFPDFHLVGQDRLEKWNNANYSRLRYQTDTKWNKGKLPEMFASYKAWVGGNPQSSKYSHLSKHGGESAFWILWEDMDKLHKFGRYSKWFTIQMLKHVGKLNVESPTLFIDDVNGSKSHRNGLMYAIGKESWINDKLNTDKIAFLTEGGDWLLQESKKRFGHLNPDYYSMETALCSFKKLFRRKQGRYLGYYIDRQGEDIAKCATDGWVGINWMPLFEGREECLHPSLVGGGICAQKMNLFLDRGTFHHLKLLRSKTTKNAKNSRTSHD